jgi:hypothetical protein
MRKAHWQLVWHLSLRAGRALRHGLDAFAPVPISTHSQFLMNSVVEIKVPIQNLKFYDFLTLLK